MKKNEKGVSAIEYGLIGALISIAIIGAVSLTGSEDKNVFCEIGKNLGQRDYYCHAVPANIDNSFRLFVISG